MKCNLKLIYFVRQTKYIIFTKYIQRKGGVNVVQKIFHIVRKNQQNGIQSF
nr:MAG TPA: hypothetical protein [Caudoviricetes sp.]